MDARWEKSPNQTDRQLPSLVQGVECLSGHTQQPEDVQHLGSPSSPSLPSNCFLSATQCRSIRLFVRAVIVVGVASRREPARFDSLVNIKGVDKTGRRYVFPTCHSNNEKRTRRKPGRAQTLIGPNRDLCQPCQLARVFRCRHARPTAVPARLGHYRPTVNALRRHCSALTLTI